jgi:mannosyltransferase OCH1-like enzyme
MAISTKDLVANTVSTKKFLQQQNSAQQSDMQRRDILERLFENYRSQNRGKVTESRIPKIIHQIWLGSPFPSAYKEWQNSWKKFHPDWEYRLWTDADVANLHLRHPEVYEGTKNFGARSDILRYEIIYKFGGLYADTDFECFKNFDDIHASCDLYAGVMEESIHPAVLAGLFGAIPGHPIVDACINNFNKPIATADATKQIQLTDGPFFTECFFQHLHEGGLLNVAFPHKYFYPWPAARRHEATPETVRSYMTRDTYAVHYWEVSWHPKKNVIAGLLGKILPVSIKNIIKRLVNY